MGALYDVGFSMNDVNPDYVVVGETSGYSFEKIQKAVHLVRNGAKLLGTNPDITGRWRTASLRPAAPSSPPSKWPAGGKLTSSASRIL